MKKIGLYILCIIIGIIVIACGYYIIQGHKEFIEYENMFENDELKHNYENEKYIITSNCPAIVENIQILEKGDLGWFDTQGKGVPIGFGGAAFYYLPYDLEHFEEYYSLVKGKTEDKYHIWKITVSDKYMDGLPALAVLKVEKPTKAEEEKEKKWLDENFVSQEPIFESNRFFSAYGNNPEWTLTVRPREDVLINNRYDAKFYVSDDLSGGVLMHLFKAGDNYRFLYDELDIRFIKGECDSGIQGDNKKAESNYKVMVFRGDEIFEGCGNIRTEEKTIKEEPEVISSENDERVKYLENLVSGDIDNKEETLRAEENYEVYYDKESDILVVEDKNMNTDNIINLKIGNAVFDVTLEKNSATKALVEKLHEGDIIVNAREYGGFEKVGNLGFNLPKTDKQITTEPGDLVLYQGNQISLFYESNSWSYTKLGRIQMISKDGLKEILGDGDVTLVFSLLK